MLPGRKGARRRTALWLGLGSGAAGAVAVLAAIQIGSRPDGASGAPVTVDLAADTVSVDRPEIDLGQVPLDKVVPVSVQLTNHSQRTVLLSQATAEALEGCWPPQPVVGSTTLKPGETTTVKFSTAMHAGMDGPHLFRIIVPTTHPKALRVQYMVKALFK